MKNKKLVIIIATAAVLVTTSITAYKLYGNNSDSDSSSSNQTIVATYKDGEVTLAQVQAELAKVILKNPNLKDLTFKDLNTSQKEMVIKEIILKEASYKEAKKQKLDKSEDYKQALKFFEAEVLQQKLFAKLAVDAKNEKNLQKNYDKLAKELKTKQDIQISYIALKTQNQADAVAKILAQYPNSFAKQAKLKSIDKAIAKKGGDLGFITEDALPAAALQQVKTLQLGQISQPFQLADKWVIIKLEATRPAQIVKFEDAKQALAASLATKAVQDFIIESLKEVDIKITIQ